MMKIIVRAKNSIKIAHRVAETFYSLAKLWLLLSRVNVVQPLYNFSIIKNKQAQQICTERADTIYQEMRSWGQRGRILDIDCNLGYFSHYFADRGYVVTGIDKNPTHIKMSKILQRINRKKTQFSVNTLSDDFLKKMNSHDYDIAFLFGIGSDLISKNQLDNAQRLVSELTEKIPVLFVELRHDIGDDESALFSKCIDVSIRKLSLLPSHDNVAWRSLFIVKKNSLYVCGEKRRIYGWKFNSHYGSGYFGRYYFDGGEVYAKRYLLPQRNNDLRQILQEIDNYKRLPNNPFFPNLLSHVIQQISIDMLFTKLPGDNLYDLLIKGQTIALLAVLVDVINALNFLFQQGLFHNDVRSWNIMFDGKKAYLFDLGLADKVETENTNIALLWVIKQIHEFKRYKFKYPVTTPPELRADDFALPVKNIIMKLQKTTDFAEFLEWFNHNQDCLTTG